MKYAWLTRVLRIAGTHHIIHETMMILPYDENVIDTLEALAQAIHYSGVPAIGWVHQPLVWRDNTAYDINNEADVLFQIRIIHTPDDPELALDKRYFGVRDVASLFEMEQEKRGARA